MLGYATPAEGRPGLLMALGIVSIVFGSLGLLVSAGQTMSWLPYATMMTMNTTTVAGTAATAASTPAGSLTPEEVTIVGDALVAAQPLSAAEEQQLRAALPKMELPLAPPAAGAAWTQQHVAGQITGTSTYSYGTGAAATKQSSVNTNDGSIDVNGGNVSSMVWSTGSYTTVDATGTATTAANGGAFGFGALDPPGWLVFAGLTAEALLALLAILLVVAGVFAIRGTPAGRSLHLWWAWWKLGLGAVAVAASIYWSVQEAQTFYGGASGFGWLLLAHPLVVGVPGLIYPIAVLGVLRTKRIRAWYSAA